MNLLSINVLELLGRVIAVFVMMTIKTDTPARAGEPVLMMGECT